jgi:hypothetical protein
MAWVRLDDTFPEHPKIDAAGGDAAWLHVCALSYCNRNETDGYVPRERITKLSDRKQPYRLAARLVAVGLWDVAVDGWQIHDYLDFQPSKAKLQAERDAAKERMREARRSRNVRPNVTRSSGEVRLTPTRPDPTPSSIQSLPTSDVGTRLVAVEDDVIGSGLADLTERLRA